jgi:hypothetical protein
VQHLSNSVLRSFAGDTLPSDKVGRLHPLVLSVDLSATFDIVFKVLDDLKAAFSWSTISNKFMKNVSEQYLKLKALKN